MHGTRVPPDSRPTTAPPPVELRRYALSVVDAADPDKPQALDDQRGNTTAATWN